MKLYKSLLIHVSNVILWASVTCIMLGCVQNPHADLPKPRLLSRACATLLPTCPLVSTSAEGLHILHEDLRRRDKTTFLPLGWPIYPRCEPTGSHGGGGWPSTSIRADILDLCLLYN